MVQLLVFAGKLPPPHTERILLIGDSTVRMVRSTFERETSLPVDMIGTSCGLHDVMFLAQIEAFFCSTQYQYSTIFVQLGHHSIKGESGEEYSTSDLQQYKIDMEGLISYLRQHSAKVVLLSSFLNVNPIPSCMSGRIRKMAVLLYRRIFGEVIDYSWSNTVIKKNEIIKNIAEEENLQYCDIDLYMRNLCKGYFPMYIHNDHIHYENRAKKIIVKKYMEFL